MEAKPRWYACWTRWRHEKRVQAMLEERGIETFLPLVERERQWRDRRKRVEFPLFPSYVFGRFRLRDSPRVLSIPGVAGLVKQNGRPAAVDEEELENVRAFAAMLRGGDVEPEPSPEFARGSEVVVMEGPFRGLRGVVTEQRGRRRVFIGLQAIGQGLILDIDPRHLRSASAHDS
ncbi:MAG TPA: UpxY family transcription antiterminator [Longimicrobiales bacterium]|nr:UpxY family transcription antiterminator [Longimicrobiales bacterium]